MNSDWWDGFCGGFAVAGLILLLRFLIAEVVL